MDAPPPISADDLAATPPAVLAYLRWQADRIAALTDQLAVLGKRVAQLEAQVGKPAASPANSSLPPSSTHPHAKPASTRPASPRKRGGQPGHLKHERSLIPSD